MVTAHLVLHRLTEADARTVENSDLRNGALWGVEMEWNGAGVIPPYRCMLRLIGRYLDDVKARSITILDQGGAFLIRYQLGDAPQLVEKHFTWDELIDQIPTTIQHRKLPAAAKNGIVIPRFSAGYEDLLRTIGYHLETAVRYLVILQEHDAGFLLSYEWHDPERTLFLHKSADDMDMGRIHRLLEEARAGRAPADQAPRWKRLLQMKGR